MNGATFANSDLSGVNIKDSNMEGMTIDGVPVADLLATCKQAEK